MSVADGSGQLAMASRSWREGLLLVRHQIAAVVATGADFGVMIALVQVLGLPAPYATLPSAMVGGAVNFAMARRWAFEKEHTGTLAGQAARYVLAMLGGAALNALLMAIVLRVATIPYPLARAFIAIAVSLLYTYPVHTRLVFRVETTCSRPSARI